MLSITVQGDLHLHIEAGVGPELMGAIGRLQDTLTAVRIHQTIEESHMGAMEDAVAALTTKVQRTTDLEQSAITLIGGLSDQLKANAQNPAAILALAAQLDAKDDELAASILANTPADTGGGTGTTGGGTSTGGTTGGDTGGATGDGSTGGTTGAGAGGDAAGGDTSTTGTGAADTP